MSCKGHFFADTSLLFFDRTYGYALQKDAFPTLRVRDKPFQQNLPASELASRQELTLFAIKPGLQTSSKSKQYYLPILPEAEYVEALRVLQREKHRKSAPADFFVQGVDRAVFLRKREIDKRRSAVAHCPAWRHRYSMALPEGGGVPFRGGSRPHRGSRDSGYCRLQRRFPLRRTSVPGIQIHLPLPIPARPRHPLWRV